MHLVIESPSKARIESISEEEMDILKRELSYINTSAQYLVKRHLNNKNWRIRNKDTWEAHYEKLKGDVKKCLIFDGNYIRPGSIPYLQEKLTISLINNIKYPTPKKIAWAKPLPFTLHDYQEISAEELIKIMHGNVELCTSAGKSAILLKVCRETGFRACVIAPSRSVFNELVEKFEKHLGRGNVGKFGDGKKTLGKLITICIGDSIANIKPGSKEWEFFSTLEMMCVDESHTWGAESLEEICHGVLANVPYRMFFSGTQTRGDGADKLLQSIIGKTVYYLPTWEAKEKGYISDHEFYIVDVESSDPNNMSPDALEMKRIHYLGNKNIAAFIAKYANAMAQTKGEQTLILVEELNQISMIAKLLKVPFVYAHSEKNSVRLLELGLEKVDTGESVEKFNKGEAMVLIGTSCISTGTNIFPTHSTFNWVGGTSEIKTKQGTVGRSVRKGEHNPWAHLCKPKTVVKIFDFNVYDIYLMQKQLEDRVSYYGDSRSAIKRIRLNATKDQKAGGVR